MKCRGLIGTPGLPTWRRCALGRTASEGWWARECSDLWILKMRQCSKQTAVMSVINLRRSDSVDYTWWSVTLFTIVIVICGCVPPPRSQVMVRAMGLKMVPLNSLNRVSYQCSIVTITLWCAVQPQLMNMTIRPTANQPTTSRHCLSQYAPLSIMSEARKRGVCSMLLRNSSHG